jgi:hypothetical protein
VTTMPPVRDAASILLSRELDRSVVTAAVHEVYGPVPAYSDLTVESHLPCEVALAWFELAATGIASWPFHIDFRVAPALPDASPQGYVLLAETLSRAASADSLCLAQDYVAGLDPADPFWSLAYVGSFWFLADDSGLDPSPDEAKGGSAPVRLYGPMERERFLARGYSREQLHECPRVQSSRAPFR